MLQKNITKELIIYFIMAIGKTQRKQGCQPITIPKHEPIKKIYVEMVRQIVESEAEKDEDTE
ncbi:MAG: hypothetical protein ACI4GD_04795 [Lachnospiraceae bacterium]